MKKIIWTGTQKAAPNPTPTPANPVPTPILQPGIYSYSINQNGAGIWQITPGAPSNDKAERPEVDVMKEKIDDYDRAMRGVG